MKPLDAHEAQLVREAYAHYRYGTRMLEVAIRKHKKLAYLIIILCRKILEGFDLAQANTGLNSRVNIFNLYGPYSS